MAREPLKSDISILSWIEMSICANCAFYKTSNCDPKIKREWRDAVSEIELDVHYEIPCFKVAVVNEWKMDLDLEEEK